MLTNPHDTCAQIINTLRISGLTYTLNETPYSVYLTLRKKFIKEYTPQPFTTPHNSQKHHYESKIVKAREHEEKIAQLQEALENEIDQHNSTKHQLSETEAEAEKLNYINNMNIEESEKLHANHIRTVHELKSELAEEVDGHARTEQALKQLEEEVEKLQDELKKKMNDEIVNVEEKESMYSKLEDNEQAIDNLNSLTRSLNKKLLRYEEKHADLATLDTFVLNAKVRELEDTVNAKERIIALLEEEAKSSQQVIDHLRQSQCHSASAPPGTPAPAHTPTQSRTLSGISQLDTDTLLTHVDSNCNLHIVSLSHPPTPSPQGSRASDTQTSPKDTYFHPPSPHNKRNCEKFCQNCQNEVPEDLDITLPSPVYFYDFLSECPSPWLHYGYCRPCLELARYQGTDITQHIAQCPAFIDQCWDGEHEDLIEYYKNTESLKHTLSPSFSSKQEAHISATHSNASSPNPYFRTNPDEYCQNCKNEISDKADIQLPCPVQYFDFITECPSPWLHYGYCPPCLEGARLAGTEIIEHITQCVALSGQCWEDEHENHIKYYQHTEAEIANI